MQDGRLGRQDVVPEAVCGEARDDDERRPDVRRGAHRQEACIGQQRERANGRRELAWACVRLGDGEPNRPK